MTRGFAADAPPLACSRRLSRHPEWALRFGATDFVNPKDHEPKRIQDVRPLPSAGSLRISATLT